MNVENASHSPSRTGSGTGGHTDWPAQLRLAFVASVFAALAALALADHVSETAIVVSVIVLATMASWYQMERPVLDHALSRPRQR